ncbi:MAG TPA: TIGR00288 family NYN domain-containing protein [Methermicoccus shengliensis]|uniref:TIGR00288 family NYN domain-containing protein n=1 Tax=Methermicoccus shengliensis TaxID=660064 RepID=A0A832VZK1_9EURY|nr:TIGR00288 family NYN domain-containing protein [Methermicoccus shengliensis]
MRLTKETLKGVLSIREYLGTKKGRRRKIALLVDGPNMLRKEFQTNLKEIREVLKEHGDIKIRKVFLNQYASEKLVEAVVNQGFDAVICPGDVDVYLAVEGMEVVHNPHIDTLALVTRDADFMPLLAKANEWGQETIVFGAEPGFSSALRNTADYVIVLHDGVMNCEMDTIEEVEEERPVSRPRLMVERMRLDGEY